MKYTIFQLPANHDRAFCDYNKSEFNLTDYVPVWTDDCEEASRIYCETLFQKFNHKLPRNYAGRSMSVSDIIVFTDGAGKSKTYYCDIVRFAEVEEG